MPRVRSVLIVDDDETILSSCKRSLKAKDRQVYTTGDPAKACQMTRTLKPDAAIVDLRLGEVSGLDLIRDLKRLHPDIQIALLSGYLSVTVTMAAVKAGAEVVLSKPMGAREIVRHIEDGTSPEPDIHETPTLERVQWEHVSRVMADTNHNNTEAAKLLGIDRTTLQRWLRRKSPKKGR